MVQRQPTPMEALKQQSARGFGKAQEYSLRSWLNAARDSFEKAITLWHEGQQPGANPAKVEDAFVAIRRAALLMQIARSHPGYPMKTAQEKDIQNAIDSLTAEASKIQPAIRSRLEQLEIEWVARHGPLASSAAASTSRAPSIASSSSAAPSVGTTSNGTRSNNPPLSPTSSSAQPAASPPLTSLQERLASLRAHGVKDTSTTRSSAPRPSNAPPAAYAPPPPPASTSRSSRSPTLDAADSPPIPRKPDSLRSPPPSPKTRAKGDFVEDSAFQRTGSAPPAIPRSAHPEIGSSLEGMGLELAPDLPRIDTAYQNGRHEQASAGGSPRSPYDQLSSLPSPTAFANNFPSIDDLEKSAPSTHADYSFPSVPNSLPSTSSRQEARSSLPPPPRPFEVDTSDFDREQRERTAAATALGGGMSVQRSASVEESARRTLPPSLVPGGQHFSSSSTNGAPPPRSASLASSRPPLPPPSASSSTNFDMPFTTEVTPTALYNYLRSSQAQAGKGPRVLLLDVRSREEYERGRLLGETVCLEPIVLRPGITSAALESALSLSPKHEQDLFAARNRYDMVVIYDRASLSAPNFAPPSTSAESQRVLWNLTSAIYEREFYKSLKRQPVLLKGGWEAWEKYVGAKGIVRDGEEPVVDVDDPQRRTDEVAQEDAKKAHRKVSVVPSGSSRTALVHVGTGAPPLGPPYTPPAASHPTDGYFPSFSSGYPSGGGALANSGVISPRLAMPPTAAQRSGSIPSFDAYSSTTSFSASTSMYGQHPQQPHIGDGVGSYKPSASSSSSPTRTRGSFGDVHEQQSFAAYSRPSIDYPQLQHRAAPPPPVSQATRPPPLPAAPLARPPPVQPAPQRSNSSFNGLHQVSSYSSARSKFPTDINFNENSIGLTGLKNLGNTCYMNSTIQCLSAAIPFARYFKDGSFRHDINTVNPFGTRGQLAGAVAELIRAIWAQQYSFLSPVTFRENICRVAPQFRGTDQHDAQEFLGFLLDGLHEDLNFIIKKPKPMEMTPDREHDLETLPPQVMSEREWEIYRMRDDSFVVQCFQGQFRNQLKCLTCGKTSTTYNTFMPLSIPIPSGRGITRASLEDCIKTFVREEILDKDDAWFCPRCKTNRKASKRLTLSRLPPILVIHLKRFSFQGPFSDKIETQVQYPLAGLDLTSFLPPPLADKRGPSFAPKGNVYDLFAVTNHYGNLSSGHYTAFVRSGREWHNIGDSKCTQVDPRVVESAKSAYILYYAMRG